LREQKWSFFVEYDGPEGNQAKRYSGNVFAADKEEFARTGCISGLGPVYYHPNSDVMWTTASHEWLYHNTRRITRKQANRIHPKLMKRVRETEEEMRGYNER
jgi:hypothetical protein